VVLNGTIAEVSDIGKSLPLCAANISMFGNGEVANRDQLESGKIVNYYEAI